MNHMLFCEPLPSPPLPAAHTQSTFQGNRARLGFSANGNDGGGAMFLEDNSYLFLIQTQFIDNAAVGSPWNATYNTHWMGGAIFM